MSEDVTTSRHEAGSGTTGGKATSSGVDRRVEAKAVKAAVNIVDVVRRYVPDLKRQGREYIGLSPFKVEKTPSFFVDPGKNTFFCFGTELGGDVIDFIVAIEGLTFHQAVMFLAGDADVPMDPRAQQERMDKARQAAHAQAVIDADKKQRRIEIARRIARQLQDGAGTLVETYLRARAIDCDALARVYGAPVPAGLKFHPSLRYRNTDLGLDFEAPAMVGLVRDPLTGVLMGIHRTFLRPDGSGKTDLAPKAKLTLGEIWGGVGALYPRRSLGDAVVMGEGYETTLTVMGALAARGEVVRGVSAITLGNMVGAGAKGTAGNGRDGKRRESVAPDAERPGLVLQAPALDAGKPTLILLQDNDGKDPQAMAAMMTRGQTKYRNLGWRVRVAVPPVGMDFNDLAQRSSDSVDGATACAAHVDDAAPMDEGTAT